MEYYLVPINEPHLIFLGGRLKDLLYSKYIEVGMLELDKQTAFSLNDEGEKKKELEKINKKIEKFYEKNNIPKYLIVYKFPSGDTFEMETSYPVTFTRSETQEKYKTSFEEVQEYFYSSLYDEKLKSYMSKKSIFEELEEKEKKKEKKRTKKNNTK